MNRNFIVLTAVLVVMIPMAHSETDPTLFPFSKTLHAESTSHGGIAAFILDEDILRHTTDTFSNLRILDSEGQETPYLMRHRQESETVTTEGPVRFTTTSLNILPENRIEIFLKKDDRDRDLVPEIITLQTRLTDYEKQVSIYAGSDGETWQLLTENALIFDYSRFIDVRSNRISIPPTSEPLIKIIITGMSENRESPLKQIITESQGGEVSKVVEKIQLNRTDFRIDRIAFHEKTTRVRATKSMTREYSVMNYKTARDPDNGDTIISFECSRVPLTAIEILTDSPNFHRNCSVQVPREISQKTVWTTIATGTLTRIRSGRFLQENLKLQPHVAQRHDTYRIVIKNNDNPPLAITGLTIRGFLWEGLFFSRPDQTYTIYYGGDTMNVPVYDIAGVIGQSREITPDAYIPGEEISNIEFTEPEKPWPMEGKTVLVIVLVLMVGILGWVIVSVVKNLD